jgi:hypothetical protein
MTRRRGGLGRRLVVVAGIVISGVAAAALTSHTVPRPPAPGQARAAGMPSAFRLTAPPSAFSIPRPMPLTDARGAARWAPVLQGTLARRSPSPGCAPVAWVSTRTPEGTTNIVEADGEVDRHGALWVRVWLSMLPNGARGWVRRQSLGGWSFVDTHLVVDRRRLTATLLRAGRVIFRAPVGVGAPTTPTPAGTFYVRDRLTDFASPMYGPLAFGTNARSPTLTDWPAGGFVGIHGTDQPSLIPGRVSHGCIRLRNGAILTLGRLMPVGTPVTIT